MEEQDEGFYSRQVGGCLSDVRADLDYSHVIADCELPLMLKDGNYNLWFLCAITYYCVLPYMLFMGIFY